MRDGRKHREELLGLAALELLDKSMKTLHVRQVSWLEWRSIA